MNKIIDKAEIPRITPREVLDAIKQTKPKKAPGLDGIQNIILKNLNKKAIVQIMYILNACINLSYFPSDWKKAKILAFHKSGKPKKEPSSYRPISLLPTLGKVAEIIINKRRVKHLQNNNILLDEQFGFRKSRSTYQQLARLTNHVSLDFNKGKSTGLLLLDIEKAFDTVWHRGLIHKMSLNSIPTYIVKFIDNYLYERSFVVSINKALSSERKIVAGVPQGSILGPTLFLVYINDVPKHPKTSLALFADDTAVFTSSWNKDLIIKYIQSHIELLEKYFLKWKIKVNTSKTTATIFSHKKSKYSSSLQIFNEKVQFVDSAKYLGLNLDTKLSYSNHILLVVKKAHAAISILYPLLCRNSSVSIKNKIIMYNMCIQPIMLYACPLWSNTCKTNYKKLQIIQNKCLKMITNVDSRIKTMDLINMYNTPLISEYVKDTAITFYNTKFNDLDILKNVCKIRKSHPFLKYKMPQQLCIT